MIVMKFGGTSVGSAASIKAVCNIIKDSVSREPIVVVSAVSKMTNALLQLANESAQGKGKETLEAFKKAHYSILKELDLPRSVVEADLSSLEKLFVQQLKKKSKEADAKAKDSFAAFGEQLSSKIVAAYLQKISIKAKAWNAWDFGFVSDSHFGSAEVLGISYSNIEKSVKNLDHIPVVTGFLAKNERKEITTIGRGGSDYTAAIIGAAIKGEEIQIWTDVDGIMSADPKVVGNATTLAEISFEEASELAYFGAKVLHPKTILPAMKKAIKVRVLNTFNPKTKGTLIISRFEDRKEQSHTVEALTYKKDAIAVHIHSPEFFDNNGLMVQIFRIFSTYKTSIDLISTSVSCVSLTIDNDSQLQKIVGELAKIGQIVIERDKAVICAVGGGINAAGVAGRMFTVLGKNNIPVEMISQAAGGISITFVVEEKDMQAAVKVLHKEYIG